ncbi:MAG: hypothetical protein D6722_18730 [Bacteroidetes bacterium]|nr:MAG: hypothetical protein D6722_18730 [Bacteroidota bacterium]
MNKNWLLKTYMAMPLWGKVVTPLVAVFLVLAALKAIKWAFWLGLIGLILYLGASAVLYFQDKGKK